MCNEKLCVYLTNYFKILFKSAKWNKNDDMCLQNEKYVIQHIF